MINIFISLLLLVASYGLFSFSFAVHGLNRLVVAAPKSIFEYCVVASDSEVISYSEEHIKEKYISYIDDHIYRYVKSRDISFRFYSSSSGGICDEDCDGVEVSIKAYVAFSYTYQRTMYYEIKEVNHG